MRRIIGVSIVAMILSALMVTGALADGEWVPPYSVSVVGCVDQGDTDPATIDVEVTNPEETWNSPGYQLEVYVLFRLRATAVDHATVLVEPAYGSSATASFDVYESTLGPYPDVVDQYRYWDIRVDAYWYDGATQIGFSRVWSAYNWVPPCPEDEDGDGVPDAGDVCPGTVPDSIPADSLLVRRYAWYGGEDFGSGGSADPVFTIFDTAGCSADQIIAAMGFGQGHSRFGLAIGEMRNWIAAL